MKQEQVDITIIGAGLTGLTLAYYLKKGGKKIRIIEKNERAGGVIETVTMGPFTYEIGPNTGVIGTPEIVELFDDLHPNCEVEIGNPASNNRWIFKNGKWNSLPSGLLSAVSTPLFKLRDKFRILGEPFRARGKNPDESVADLVRRRMGESFLNYAVDPFISGVYAGDPEKLITRYALPKLYNLEQNYGSFIRGSMKKKKEPKTELEKRVSRKVFSVKGGLQNLIDALVAGIGKENITLGCSDATIHEAKDGFLVSFSCKGQTLEIIAKKVVSTVGAHALNQLLPFVGTDLMEPVTKLEYARVAEGIACFNNWPGKKLDAFGGLVPSREKREILGVLFPSSLFENRAPQGGAVLTFFMGGRRKPDFIDKSDEEIQNIIIRELSETLDCNRAPDILKIHRYEHAIPQYEISSGERFKAIESIEAQYPGLILAGNMRDGIGMADRVKQGRKLASKLLT